MQVKPYELALSIEAMSKINSLDLPVSLAVELVRNAKEMQLVVDEFQKRERALLQEYGTEEKNTPGAYTLDKERLPEFEEKMDALRAETVDIPIRQVRISELGTGGMVSAQDLMALEWFFLDEPAG